MCISPEDILEELDNGGEKYEINKYGQIIEYGGK